MAALLLTNERNFEAAHNPVNVHLQIAVKNQTEQFQAATDESAYKVHATGARLK